MNNAEKWVEILLRTSLLVYVDLNETFRGRDATESKQDFNSARQVNFKKVAREKFEGCAV